MGWVGETAFDSMKEIPTEGAHKTRNGRLECAVCVVCAVCVMME